MVLSILAVLLGFALLVVAADKLLVPGAVGLARLLALTPAVIGLTVVALGTSMPELAVSSLAALDGSPDIAMGNVLGSNIMNVALVLGLTASIAPIAVRGSVVKLEWPFMFLASVLLFLLARDGLIDRVEGMGFIALLIGFTTLMIWLARRSVKRAAHAVQSGTATTPTGDEELDFDMPVDDELMREELIGGLKGLLVYGAMVTVGIALLVVGAKIALYGAVEIARAFELSERIIGLTIIAFGTSLPELVASVVAALKGEDELALGNILGSNIYNILCILGVTATLAPVPVAPAVLEVDAWMMLGTSFALFPMMVLLRRIPRLGGVALLASALTYTGWLLLS